MNDILRNIDLMRVKMDQLWDQMTAEDFARVHAKFVGAVISIETGFKKRFPEEWVKYEKQFYGDD